MTTDSGSGNQIEKLKNRIAQLEHDQRVNEVLLEISNAVDTTPNLYDLYSSIHQALNRLVDATNFYISIYDEENSLLHFPYFLDEADGDHTESVRMFDEESLTGEVLLKQAPVLLDDKDLEKRDRENRIVGTMPHQFIGVPLKNGGVTFGVMAIQSYSHAVTYTQEDLDLMVSVSKHVAVAIERKRINDALKENEARYRTLSEMSMDIIMRFDRHYRHLYVNSAIRQIGLEPDQMIGKTHEELGFPEDLIKEWHRAIDTVFQTGQVNRIEFELPDHLWIDWLLCPEFSGDAKVNSVITFARDITQRKQQEYDTICYDRINKIIINSTDVEEMLNGILDTMVDIFQSDRAWILFPCNPVAPYYEVPFLRCRKEYFVPPGDKFEISSEARHILAKILASDEPTIFDSRTGLNIREEVRAKRQVKSQMAMAVFPKIGDAWEVGLHQCSYDRVWTMNESRLFKEICLRIADGLNSMLLLRELRQAKKYIDNIVDSMPSILVGVDFNGKITQWNQKAATETGTDAKEALGKRFQKFFPYLTDFEQTIRQAVDGKKVVKKNKVLNKTGAQSRYENITVYPLRGTENKGAVIKMDDVTEQVMIEEMMIQSEKMLSVGGLAAGMAHEINNPLAGMMQNAQVLLNRLSQDLPANRKAAQKVGITMDALKSYMEERKILSQLEHINEAGRRAAKVVENMLSFAKKAGQTRDYENLPDLLNRTIELARNDYDLKKRFDFRQIKIVIDKEDQFPMVLCEGSKIQQVFLNIIKNGAQAMADSPETIASGPEFQITCRVEKETAVITIADNGPGMDEDVRKRVFEPFYTTKSPDRGTGLGLSVAYFIITEDHNGELAVTSDKGQGTCFTVRLPIHG